MKEDVFGTQALAVKDDNPGLNAFIENNSSFIKHCAYKTVHRFVSDSDDEYAVAMSAFCEAVRSFDESKGTFSSFAQMVIKRRLLDFMDKEYRRQHEICVDPGIMEGELDDDGENPIIQSLKEASEREHELKDTAIPGALTVKDEIEALSQVLEDYGFSFMDLTECSPQAQKTKTACGLVIKTLIESELLMSRFRKAKTLPIKELSGSTGISRKILDRHRRYIIASVEILTGEYPLLQEYMQFVKSATTERTTKA